jgi:hypothetical protein
MKDTLNPSHKLWPIFRRRLDDTLFTYANDKLHNQCKGDLTLTIEILKSLENIDVEETVILFKEYGGHCDCKVIMNVARIWNNR